MPQPLTRDLSKIIEAAEIIEAELEFQADRIMQRVSPGTQNESEHLSDLIGGYRQAARYVRILKRYQEGRRERRSDAESPYSNDHVDRSGVALPFTEEPLSFDPALLCKCGRRQVRFSVDVPALGPRLMCGPCVRAEELLHGRLTVRKLPNGDEL